MLRKVSNLEGSGICWGDLKAYGVCKRPQCLGYVGVVTLPGRCCELEVARAGALVVGRRSSAIRKYLRADGGLMGQAGLGNCIRYV
jgi:hypothetical protein